MVGRDVGGRWYPVIILAVLAGLLALVSIPVGAFVGFAAFLVWLHVATTHPDAPASRRRNGR